MPLDRRVVAGGGGVKADVGVVVVAAEDDVEGMPGRTLPGGGQVGLDAGGVAAGGIYGGASPSGAELIGAEVGGAELFAGVGVVGAGLTGKAVLFDVLPGDDQGGATPPGGVAALVAVGGMAGVIWSMLGSSICGTVGVICETPGGGGPTSCGGRWSDT